jgi:flagellin
MNGIYVNDNIPSMNAQDNLLRTQESLNKHINRLSSGYRVSTPADDPAGYAISQRMGGQVLSYNAAVRNTNDGANLLETASGALQTDNAILLKMRQLAIEASNGTYSGKDLGVLNQEYDNLKKELTRVSKVTDFNGMKLLDGSHKDFRFQVGIGTNPENRLKVEIGKIDSKTLNLEGTSLMSRAHSLISVKALDYALDKINNVQGNIGAIQNRMEWTLKNLNSANTNVSASRAGIRDADFAKETAAFTKEQILSKTGEAVLAQANTLAKAALNLLA